MKLLVELDDDGFRNTKDGTPEILTDELREQVRDYLEQVCREDYGMTLVRVTLL